MIEPCRLKIERVAIWDSAGRLLYESRPAPFDTPPDVVDASGIPGPSHRVEADSGGRRLRAFHPIVLDGHVLGFFEAEEDFEPLSEHIHEMQAFAATSMVGFSALLYVLLFRLVRAAARDLAAKALANRRLFDRVETSERRFRSLVQQASDVIAILDAQAVVRYVSPPAPSVLGLEPAVLIGRLFSEMIHAEDVNRLVDTFGSRLLGQGEATSLELRIRHADGGWRHIEVIASNLIEDPGVAGVVLNCRDITERKELEEQLRRQAFHDALTGLPNRALFLDRLEQALARAHRSGERIAVLFLDLDRFKVVNDSLGHAAGDALLVATGRRLMSALRPGDTLARLGGDELTDLLDALEDSSTATTVADRLCTALMIPFLVEGHEVFVTASIGIAVSEPGLTTSRELLSAADLALYRAKDEG